MPGLGLDDGGREKAALVSRFTGASSVPAAAPQQPLRSRRVAEDHGRAFWQTLGRVMPDYDARKARLRELGPALVW